jgi:hypothetical protein
MPQADKLKLGKVRSTTAFFGTSILVHVSLAPLVVSLIARDDVNLGMVDALVPKLQAALAPIQKEAELW